MISPDAPILFRANGGPSSTRDSIPAMLSNGEFVVNAKSTRENREFLERINSGLTVQEFASGGLVSQASTGLASIGNAIVPRSMTLSPSDLASEQSEERRGGVTVQMNISTPDAGSFRRSQSQVAAEIGRMIRQGQARQT